jgi:RsiW-degrading membrane proteinase PrsW (M82 family)
MVPLLSFSNADDDLLIFSVISLTFALLTVGAGGAAFLHADRSLQNKPSKPLRLPQATLLVGIFIPLLLVGIIFQLAEAVTAILFPFVLVTCAILPPLWAVAWMIPRASAAEPALTWRRGLLSFAGGATISVLIAIGLEILLPVIAMSLVNDLEDAVQKGLQGIFRALSNADVAAALTDPDFIYIFVQLAVIAPLAEELAKPLVTLPLLRRLGKKEAFWIGALAGAGFAALENVIYATAGLSIWAGILLVRALGGALHPLGSGLVAQGWHAVLHGEKEAGRSWWKRFGIAVAVHAAWNGGSLLVITLGGARFFGKLPPEIDLLGLSAAGITLAFLIVLGIAALWIGRLYGYERSVLTVDEQTSPETGHIPSDQALAVWALVCLLAIVPAGIAGLKLWLR